jgi:DNA-binding response OmpR family regulator
MKVLLADDDTLLAPMVRDYLMAKGVDVRWCENGSEALEVFGQDIFDLCIFDVQMPFRDGFELATEVRRVNKSIPILFLTGKNETKDKIKGFELGADDYVTKPFSLEELYLRVKALTRRIAYEDNRKEVPIGKFVFRPIKRELQLGENVRPLSAKETQLLSMLVSNLNNVITRHDVLRLVWGDDMGLKGESLNVYITKLRKLLKDDPDVAIMNVHGEGYTLTVSG